LKSSEVDIAILATDEVRAEYIDSHGDYPDMFTTLLEQAAADRAEPVSLKLTTYDARHAQFPEPDAHPAYLITGSRLSVYDDEAWIEVLADFLEEVLRAGGKVIGICFGHQLMAHFFGGRTEPAEQGWAVGVQENRTVASEPWMSAGAGEGGDRLNLLASHKDQVTRLPDGAKLIATSDFCPVGGFVVGDQVLTLQGHPEFRKDYSRDLMVMRRELIGEEVFELGVASLDKETDDDKVGHWIIDFVRAGKVGGEAGGGAS
jgi:GMP synthase-like glutamine amidotransferase